MQIFIAFFQKIWGKNKIIRVGFPFYQIPFCPQIFTIVIRNYQNILFKENLSPAKSVFVWWQWRTRDSSAPLNVVQIDSKRSSGHLLEVIFVQCFLDFQTFWDWMDHFTLCTAKNVHKQTWEKSFKSKVIKSYAFDASAIFDKRARQIKLK